MRVLAVDDNEVSLAMVHEILTKAGFDVETARDGREAIAAIRERQIRLVVSDWEMPNMSGLALCRVVRTEGLSDYVYIILLTGHDSLEEKIAGLSVGADDYLAKPFNAEELIARVRCGERVLSFVGSPPVSPLTEME